MYKIERRQTVTSTNDVCMEHGARGGKEHYVCCAGMQTKGRGRNGREWISPDATGLYLSIMERPDMDANLAPMLSIVMGLAAVRAVEEVSLVKPKLKWPNDLVVDGKKISGILAQMQLTGESIDYVVIGIGINMFQTEFPEEIAKKATSLLLEQGIREADLKNSSIFREKMENSIVKWWETYYNQFMQVKSLEPFIEEYRKASVNIDKRVKILDLKESYTGTCLGITKGGELVVELEDHTKKIVRSGEVSVRGIYGYVDE